MHDMIAGVNFRFNQFPKWIVKEFVFVSTHTPFSACTCEGKFCTCEEEPTRVIYVSHNASKKRVVGVLGHLIGYKSARRLWANAKLHVLRGGGV